MAIKIKYRKTVVRSSPLVVIGIYMFLVRAILKKLVEMGEAIERED